jgi:hypothetical protein
MTVASPIDPSPCRRSRRFRSACSMTPSTAASITGLHPPGATARPHIPHPHQAPGRNRPSNEPRRQNPRPHHRLNDGCWSEQTLSERWRTGGRRRRPVRFGRALGRRRSAQGRMGRWSGVQAQRQAPAPRVGRRAVNGDDGCASEERPLLGPLDELLAVVDQRLDDLRREAGLQVYGPGGDRQPRRGHRSRPTRG